MSVISYMGKDQNRAVFQIVQSLSTVNSPLPPPLSYRPVILAVLQFWGKDRKIP